MQIAESTETVTIKRETRIVRMEFRPDSGAVAIETETVDTATDGTVKSRENQAWQTNLTALPNSNEVSATLRAYADAALEAAKEAVKRNIEEAALRAELLAKAAEAGGGRPMMLAHGPDGNFMLVPQDV